ncbi:kelch-like protein 9 [Episyrphus balteatus]|uniref:kelch-like protein 9 n=1 Tax=Episyrphus balteatus TaxID=286459 RepID=UPI00248557C5|nr:kelch-like protein 9 [Episyrphus balteatus]
MSSKFWTSTKHKRLPIKYQNLNNSIVIGTRLYVIGGCETTTTNNVGCLDLVGFNWLGMPSMRKTQGCRNQMTNLNGNLCVFGGLCDCSIEDSLEIFDFSTCEWYNIELLYTPSKDSRIIGHNGILYLFDFVNGLLQCYDSDSNEWSCKVIEQIQLKNFSLAGIGEFLYIIGGERDYDPVNNVMRYDISKNRMSEVRSLTNARSAVNSVIFRNKIVIFGGFPCWKLIEEYNPDIDSWKELNPISMNGNSDSILCTLPSFIK